jgi:hypothetical protein
MQIIVIKMEFLPAHGYRMSPVTASAPPSKYPIPEIVTGKPKASAMIARISRARITPNWNNK